MAYKRYMQKIFLKNLGGILEEKGMTQEALAKKVRVKQPYISKLKKLREAGDITLAYKIADVLGVSIQRLTGRPEPTPRPVEIRVTWEASQFPGKEAPPPAADFLPIPVYNINVVGGDPETIAREEIEDVALIHRAALQRKSPRGLVGTFVRGDSMIPVLRDGAIVCIDTTARPERGKVPKGSIWAIRKEEGVVVKHLQVGEGALVLISANPAYPPEAISGPEAIVGRVIWVWQGL